MVRQLAVITALMPVGDAATRASVLVYNVCSYVLDNMKVGYLVGFRCADAQHARWEGVNGTSFHSCYSLATVSSDFILYHLQANRPFNTFCFTRCF